MFWGEKVLLELERISNTSMIYLTKILENYALYPQSTTPFLNIPKITNLDTLQPSLDPGIISDRKFLTWHVHAFNPIEMTRLTLYVNLHQIVCYFFFFFFFKF